MPKTVTLSDDELLALQAMRQLVADTLHPARPAAIAALDRIKTQPEDGLRWPFHGRTGPIPLDPSYPDGHRSSTLEWRSDETLTDIMIPAGQDLRLELRRPGSNTALMCWPIGAGDPDHRRALWRMSFQAITRPH